MKRLLIQMTITVAAFGFGVYAVSFFWYPLTRLTANAEHTETVFQVPVTPVMSVTTGRFNSLPNPDSVRVAPSPNKKTQGGKSIPITKHDSFEDICLRLRKLPAFMDKKGGQTFYISDVNYDEGEYAYAYWKEENSIIVLHLPVYGEPTEAELYWLSGKAYTDLNKDVVPRELGNMGCCLVTKAWADKAVKSCNAGYKLKVTVDK